MPNLRKYNTDNNEYDFIIILRGLQGQTCLFASYLSECVARPPLQDKFRATIGAFGGDCAVCPQLSE